MQSSNPATSTLPSQTSKFVLYYGDIISNGVNIGEAHLHPDGSIEIMVTDPPSGNTATLYALGSCKPSYIIVPEPLSDAGPFLQQEGCAIGKNKHIQIAFSSVKQMATPCSLRLLSV